MPRAMDRPRPEPELGERWRRIGSNGAWAMSGCIPGPLSATLTVTVSGPSALAGDHHPGAGRVVADRVGQQVHEHLLQTVVVGPDRRQVGRAPHADQQRPRRRQARDRGVEDQRDVTPIPLQLQDAGLDRGKAQQVVHEPAEPGRLGRDPGQEPLLGFVVPGHIGLQQAGGVSPDRGERGAQLVTQPGQEAALQLPGPAQGGGLLVGEPGLLPLQRQPQRVGRVFQQGRGIRRRRARPATGRPARPARRERERPPRAASRGRCGWRCTATSSGPAG